MVWRAQEDFTGTVTFIARSSIICHSTRNQPDEDSRSDRRRLVDWHRGLRPGNHRNPSQWRRQPYGGEGALVRYGRTERGGEAQDRHHWQCRLQLEDDVEDQRDGRDDRQEENDLLS